MGGVGKRLEDATITACMLRWVLAVLLVIPLIDILVLIYLAGRIGIAGTVAIVVLTGLIGLLLVRAEGRYAITRLQQKVITGEMPTDELLDGGLLLVAGALMITPGLVTDAIGLALVLPPSRYVVRKAVKRWIVIPLADARTGGFVTGSVYTGGFPGGSSEEINDPVDLSGDAYDVEVEDGGDDGGKGNA